MFHMETLAITTVAYIYQHRYNHQRRKGLPTKFKQLCALVVLFVTSMNELLYMTVLSSSARRMSTSCRYSQLIHPGNWKFYKSNILSWVTMIMTTSTWFFLPILPASTRTAPSPTPRPPPPHAPQAPTPQLYLSAPFWNESMKPLWLKKNLGMYSLCL